VRYILCLALCLIGCSDPVVAFMRTEHPNCDVVKHDFVNGYEEVYITCGNSPPRLVRVKQR
jgi:hypothetical protein